MSSHLAFICSRLWSVSEAVGPALVGNESVCSSIAATGGGSKTAATPTGDSRTTSRPRDPPPPPAGRGGGEPDANGFSNVDGVRSWVGEARGGGVVEGGGIARGVISGWDPAAENSVGEPIGDDAFRVSPSSILSSISLYKGTPEYLDVGKRKEPHPSCP